MKIDPPCYRRSNRQMNLIKGSGPSPTRSLGPSSKCIIEHGLSFVFEDKNEWSI